MNLVLQSRHARYPDAIALLLEEELLALAERCRAEEAIVCLTQHPDASPRYQVTIFVRLPGPDLHATGCDHTVAVAVRKALRQLEAQLVVRSSRRQQRQRSNLQQSSASRTGRVW
jgi:ribosome-associated translation inhibitor RaiA